MRLQIKQKLLSMMDEYRIYDEDGTKKYFAKAVYEYPGYQLHLYNPEGQKLGTVLDGALVDRPTFEVIQDGKTIGSVQKKGVLRAKYEVDLCGWRFEKVDANRYTVYDGERIAVQITKKTLQLLNTYTMEYERPEDEISALLMVLAMSFDTGRV